MAQCVRSVLLNFSSHKFEFATRLPGSTQRAAGGEEEGRQSNGQEGEDKKTRGLRQRLQGR